MKHYWNALFLAALIAVWAPGAQSQTTTPQVSVKIVATHPLAGERGKEVVIAEVSLPPGSGSMPHRHNANTFVYVLQGQVEMQVKGGPLRSLGPGEVFYESPTDIHTVSRNPSATVPAKLVVTFIKNTGAALTTPVVPANQ